MIFLCFANKDRYTIAESVLYHLENFGIEVWYDRHSLIIGDNRVDINFEEGIRSNRYAILLITPNIESNICANEEILVVREQYEMGRIVVFPIFYNIIADDLPVKYYWLKELIYREVTDQSGTLLTVSSIACRYLKDIVQSLRYHSLYDCTNSSKITDKYINKLVLTYYEIDNNNFNSKMTLLYALYCYILMFYPGQYPMYCIKPFEMYFSMTKLNLEIDFKEMRILEYSLLILLHKALKID